MNKKYMIFLFFVSCLFCQFSHAIAQHKKLETNPFMPILPKDKCIVIKGVSSNQYSYAKTDDLKPLDFRQEGLDTNRSLGMLQVLVLVNRFLDSDVNPSSIQGFNSNQLVVIANNIIKHGLKERSPKDLRRGAKFDRNIQKCMNDNDCNDAISKREIADIAMKTRQEILGKIPKIRRPAEELEPMIEALRETSTWKCTE